MMSFLYIIDLSPKKKERLSSSVKKKKAEHSLTLYTKIISKKIKDLNIA